MKKHAYLITAYDNLYVLDKLVRLLDNEANDIYIHCDIKFTKATEWIEHIPSEMIYSKIIFLDRKDIKWGAYSYTEVIMQLLIEASKYKYSYYHLLTGTSFPIKTQKYIHDFFDNNSEDKLYFHVNAETEKIIQDRCKAYYPLIDCKYYRSSKILKAISTIAGKLQIAVGVNRLKDNQLSPIYNGWGWFSVPDDFAQYACTMLPIIRKTFKYTLAADEAWIGSVAMHSPFKERVTLSYSYSDALNNSKHFQDWTRGKPYCFTEEDYDLLMKDNPCFFARKFSDDNRELVDRIFNTLKEEI